MGDSNIYKGYGRSKSDKKITKKRASSEEEEEVPITQGLIPELGVVNGKIPIKKLTKKKSMMKASTTKGGKKTKVTKKAVSTGYSRYPISKVRSLMNEGLSKEEAEDQLGWTPKPK